MSDQDEPRPIYSLESPTARTRMVEIGDKGAALEEGGEPFEVVGITPDTMQSGVIKKWVTHLRDRQGGYRWTIGQLYWVEPTYVVEVSLSLANVLYLENAVNEGMSAVEMKVLQAYEDGKGA